jgi:hypothetical protein
VRQDGALSIEKITDSDTDSTKRLNKTESQSTVSVTGRKSHAGMGALVIKSSGGQRNTIIGTGGWLVP